MNSIMGITVRNDRVGTHCTQWTTDERIIHINVMLFMHVCTVDSRYLGREMKKIEVRSQNVPNYYYFSTAWKGFRFLRIANQQ